MNKEIAKKAFESAEKELKEKQIAQLKEVVKTTLGRIQEIEQEIDVLQDEKKILKLDIDDLKQGRLDRIEERQKKDDKAKKVSVIVVKKKVVNNHHYDNYHMPYVLTVNTPSWSAPVYCTTTTNDTSGYSIGGSTFTLDSSTAKYNTVGTYVVGNGSVHLR